MAGSNNGTGQPLVFRCWAQRRLVRYPNPRSGGVFPSGHEDIRRTGRIREEQSGGARMMHEAHEYRCECGHSGWSKHRGVLHYPVAEMSEF